MIPSDQPRESDLELVVSLDGNDVDVMDAALLQAIDSSWRDALDVVTRAHQRLQGSYPSVPRVFYSYRLRMLVAAGVISATGTVDHHSRYQVRIGDPN